RLWLGCRKPTCAIAGQSVCSGCGSDCMSCAMTSLLTNVTWLPRGTVIGFGLTPVRAIVIVRFVAVDVVDVLDDVVVGGAEVVVVVVVEGPLLLPLHAPAIDARKPAAVRPPASALRIMLLLRRTCA